MSLQEICNKTGMAINSVSGRVNDLKKANQVVEAEKRKCSVTCKTITPVTALRF
jgi:DNA-binding transcriptional regulator GbsR (MarR family)